MTLEFVLLTSFVGLLFISTFSNGESGLVAQFTKNMPALALRMEKKMVSGKCFQITQDGVACQGSIWQAPASE